MRHQHSGFTLIELMIVVAIVSILASIAMPLYMGFVAKAKWKSSFSELSAGKISIDALRVIGDSPRLEDIHVPARSIHCANALSFDALGVGTYECEIIGGPSMVDTGTITLTRSIDGDWSCSTTVEQRFAGEASQCTGR